MFRYRPRTWMLLLAGLVVVACVVTSRWVGSDANSRPVVTSEPMASVSAATPRSSAGSLTVPSAAPVYQDTDSLAFRELVALPTEHVDPELLAQADPHRLVRVKLLGFNDFHGSLSASYVLEGRPVGGAAVLASYLRAHSRGFEERSVIAHAGDFVGASPAVSSLFQDEPSIAFFNRLSNGQCDRQGRNPRCNLVGLLGNHEFDEGTTELMRMVRGGNHSKGPFLGAAYRGELYPTLCANVINVDSGRVLLPPYVIKELAGVRVGFVGAVLTGTSWFLKESGIANVKFQDEAASINASVNALRDKGVRAIVVLIHQGGKQRFSRDLPRDATTVSGEVAGIIANLHGEVDVVVSGHSHTALSALLPNREGRPTLLTQAFHSGTAFADIEADIDSTNGQVVAKRCSIVTTFADAGPGLTPDGITLDIVRTAERAAEKTTHTVVGQAGAIISARTNEHGESPLGDLVADAQRSAAQADFAFTAPTGVRADLDPGPVTWGDLFEIQPFGNRLMLVELQGKQVVALLNQQWSVESYSRILHISGLAYSWDGRNPPDARVVEVTVRGQPIEPNRKYMAVMNEVLAEGAEGFSVLAKLSRKASKLFEIDALVSYVGGEANLLPRLDGRIRRVDVPRIQ